MDDHLNYYKSDRAAYLFDKAQIFINQTPSDTFVVSDQVLPQLDAYKHVVQSHVSVARAGKIELSVPGEHNQLNAACALEAARALGIDDDVSFAALKNFKGVEGRLQFVREVRGIKIYNDNNSTTPDATIAALNAVGGPQTLLIMGGADKGLDMSALLARLPEQKRVVWLAGTGTDKAIPADAVVYDRLESALQDVMGYAVDGDTVLLSPAFASFGMFKNEYDRNDQFVALVTALA
jgi:UDP-N-acetylmuramoylalanine--D-glutamate ligase